MQKKDFRRKISYKAQDLLCGSQKESLYSLVILVKGFIEDPNPREKLKSLEALAGFINEAMRKLSLDSQDALIGELENVFFIEYRGKVFNLSLDLLSGAVVKQV